jgi:hypothetical protein
MHPTRIFKSPDELLKAWEGYKASLIEEAKKWPKVQYVGKDGMRVEDYPKLPLTLDSFEVYCYENHGCVNQYFANKDGLYDDFVTLTTRIRMECRADQITGGALKVYDQRIVASLNGLRDHIQNENTGAPTKVEFIFADMSGTPKDDDE